MVFRLAFEWFCLMFMMVSVAIAQPQPHGPRKIFNVLKYGAVADGQTDNSKAFLKAWSEACEWKGRARVWIPKGTYMLEEVAFEGPCKGFMAFVIKGVLKAPTHPSLIHAEKWINFKYVQGLTVSGGGRLDGQGAVAWPRNRCDKNPNCPPLPMTMRFDFVTNSRVHHLRSYNSKNTHFMFFGCDNMNVTNIRISAPGDSPNTDGIHIGSSQQIKFSRLTIGTGDDCISMGPGSKNIHISDVSCGPGHGISVGSLGKYPNEEEVVGITVKNCTFRNTTDGLRIKTWASAMATKAYNITFEDIEMHDVRNPIKIDQLYCPYPPCNLQTPSHVKISDVTYRNIRGTSSSKVAVSMQCSPSKPCERIVVKNINIAYKGAGGPATTVCAHASGKSFGHQKPPSCL